MTKYLTTLGIAALFGLLTTSSLLGQDLSEIQGKWTLKKNSDRWGDVTQTVEVKDTKFTYRIQSKAGDTLLYAKGSLKLEKLGPFKVVRFNEIEGGYGEDSIQPVNDDRAAIYATGWNSWTIALNFDAYRDGEEPVADTYTKAKN